MNKILIATAFIIASTGAYSGFYAGEFWQRRLDEREAIRNEVAFWNPKTAEFVWGNLEASNLERLSLNEVMQPARKPKQ